jgi:signal transduction histidine kinase
MDTLPSTGSAASESILGLLAEFITFPILVTDLDLRIVAVNRRMSLLLGLPEARPGLQLAAASHPDNAIMNAMLAALAAGPGERSIIPAPSTGMLQGKVVVSPELLYVELGSKAEAWNDTTDLWEAIDGLAHAFQTPLTSIAGYAETLLAQSMLSDEVHRGFLERIHSQSRRLAKTVDDLLFLTRMEAGKRTLDLQPIDLRMPVVEALQDYLAVAEEKGLGLEINLSERPVRVMGHLDSIYEAVANLLDNAIKHTPYAGQIFVTLSEDGDRASVVVMDTGHGIDAVSLPHLFKRFYRTDAASRSGIRGNGLGLAKVRSICEAHSGSVSARSELGRGAEFTITLPTISDLSN